MICPNCGKNNKETARFCTSCGTKLVIDPENEETVILQDHSDFENEKTTILTDSYDALKEFENEETVILQDHDDFENEKTTLLTDSDDILKDFENEETMIMNDSEKTGNLKDTAYFEVPDYDFKAGVAVYKEPSKFNQDTEYISHLRALKQLWDDGIITEDEFERKKKQILGI